MLAQRTVPRKQKARESVYVDTGKISLICLQRANSKCIYTSLKKMLRANLTKATTVEARPAPVTTMKAR